MASGGGGDPPGPVGQAQLPVTDDEGRPLTKRLFLQHAWQNNVLSTPRSLPSYMAMLRETKRRKGLRATARPQPQRGDAMAPLAAAEALNFERRKATGGCDSRVGRGE